MADCFPSGSYVMSISIDRFVHAVREAVHTRTDVLFELVRLATEESIC